MNGGGAPTEVLPFSFIPAIPSAVEILFPSPLPPLAELFTREDDKAGKLNL